MKKLTIKSKLIILFIILFTTILLSIIFNIQGGNMDVTFKKGSLYFDKHRIKKFKIINKKEIDICFTNNKAKLDIINIIQIKNGLLLNVYYNKKNSIEVIKKIITNGKLEDMLVFYNENLKNNEIKAMRVRWKDAKDNIINNYVFIELKLKKNQSKLNNNANKISYLYNLSKKRLEEMILFEKGKGGKNLKSKSISWEKNPKVVAKYSNDLDFKYYGNLHKQIYPKVNFIKLRKGDFVPELIKILELVIPIHD